MRSRVGGRAGLGASRHCGRRLGSGSAGWILRVRFSSFRLCRGQSRVSAMVRVNLKNTVVGKGMRSVRRDGTGGSFQRLANTKERSPLLCSHPDTVQEG